ncbi:hypothetical protein [Intestinimonas butyriciproducens]|uniref:hypothetical protein n=1 Tax=Intestinimonas butyriciproducens TaxID=1297617 RepID=UPI0034A140D4
MELCALVCSAGKAAHTGDGIISCIDDTPVDCALIPVLIEPGIGACGTHDTAYTNPCTVDGTVKFPSDFTYVYVCVSVSGIAGASKVGVIAHRPGNAADIYCA